MKYLNGWDQQSNTLFNVIIFFEFLLSSSAIFRFQLQYFIFILIHSNVYIHNYFKSYTSHLINIDRNIVLTFRKFSNMIDFIQFYQFVDRRIHHIWIELITCQLIVKAITIYFYYFEFNNWLKLYRKLLWKYL